MLLAHETIYAACTEVRIRMSTNHQPMQRKKEKTDFQNVGFM